MFKKLALLAVAAVVLYSAAPAAPAAAQGINVQIGGGGGYHRDRGYHRGYRGDRPRFVHRDRGYHRGYGNGPRGRAIILDR